MPAKTTSPFKALGATSDDENEMAERKGFEPSRRYNTPTPLAGERLRPLGHLSAFVDMTDEKRKQVFFGSNFQPFG